MLTRPALALFCLILANDLAGLSDFAPGAPPFSVMGASALASSPVLPTRTASNDSPSENNSSSNDSVQSYQRQLAKAAGQASALGIACKKLSREQAGSSRAELRAKFASRGVKGEIFDEIYQSSFDATISKFAADPGRGRQACEQLDAMARGLGKN